MRIRQPPELIEPWVKIKNPKYSQVVGRREQFEGLRGEKRLARRREAPVRAE